MSGSWAAGWLTGDVVTGTEFAKGVGSIYDTTLLASVASIDITSIPQTYAHLLLVVYARDDSAGVGPGGANLRFNGDAGSNYDYQNVEATGASVAGSEAYAQTSGFGGLTVGGGSAANQFATNFIVIPHYAGTANNKCFDVMTGAKWGTATGDIRTQKATGYWRSSSAISRVTIVSTSGNLAAGTRATLYAMGA